MLRIRRSRSHTRFAILAGLLVAPLACSHAPSAPPDDEAQDFSAAMASEYGDSIPYDIWLEDMSRALTGLEKLDFKSDWFDVYQIVPGVRAIHEPGPWESVLSYLVDGSARTVLFDTGLGIATIKPVTDQLTEKPVTVVSSHSHYDHVGGNHLYSDVWAHVDDFARANARGTPNAVAREFVPEESFLRTPPLEFDRSTYSIKPWVITRELADGEIIDLGDRSLEVIYTPGHAPDSICLLDRANRLLFTGDTIYLGPVYAQLEESDIRDYHRSTTLLAALEGDVDWLFPAHSAPTRDTKWLSRFHDAFSRIMTGGANSIYRSEEPWGKMRIYPHEGFWIMTRPDALQSE